MRGTAMKKVTSHKNAALASAAVLGLLASAAVFAADAGDKKPAASETSSAKPAAKIPNARSAMTGQWNRYPEIDEKPSPEFPPAAPIPVPPLKAEYKAAYDTHRKMLADAEAAGKPLYSNYTACIPD